MVIFQHFGNTDIIIIMHTYNHAHVCVCLYRLTPACVQLIAHNLDTKAFTVLSITSAVIEIRCKRLWYDDHWQVVDLCILSYHAHTLRDYNIRDM